MADSIKRIQWSRDKQTQDRVLYYLFQKAKAVVTAGTDPQDQLDLANRVYSQSVNLFAACMICATNAKENGWRAKPAAGATIAPRPAAAQKNIS